MKRTLLTLLLVAMFLQAGAITLEDAQKSALEKNYGYAAVKEDLTKSKLSVNSAISGFLPQASVKAGYLIYSPEVKSVGGYLEDRTSFSLQISQPLFTGGKKWYNYQISKDSETMQQNRLTAEMITLLNQVEAAYLNLLEKKELLSISEESLALAKKNEESSQIKQQAGLISYADRLKSSSARAGSEVEVISNEKFYETAKISFTNLTGQQDFALSAIPAERYQAFIVKMQKLSKDEIVKKQQSLLDLALANNFDSKNSELNKSISEYKITMNQGNFLPSVNLAYATEWAKSNLDSKYNNNGTVTLSASLPIFPLYDNYLEVEKSKIDLKKADLAQKQLNENITAQINTSLYSLVLSARQYESSKIAEELALETYQNIEERANANIATEDELNTARINFVKAKYNTTSAYYAILRAKSDLMKILGSENESVIIGLLQ